MWTDQRTLVPLHDVLALFQPNDWQWTIKEFDGFGRFPTDMTWAEFQDIVDAGTAVFDWNGIQQFAEGIDQMIDGRIVATDASGTTVVIIAALDSTAYVQHSAPSLRDRDDQPDHLRTFTLRGSYSRIIPCPSFGVNLNRIGSCPSGRVPAHRVTA